MKEEKEGRKKKKKRVEYTESYFVSNKNKEKKNAIANKDRL